MVIAPVSEKKEREKYRKNNTATSLVSFVPDSELDIISPILDRIFILEKEADTVSIDIPSVTETKLGYFEEVSNLNGISIPIMFYDYLRPEKATNTLQRIISQDIQRFDPTKHSFLRNAVKNMPETCNTSSDYLYLANISSAIDTELYSKIKQINVDDSTTSSTLYKTNYNEIGDDLYHDFFIEVSKKFSKKFKGTFMYSNQFNNVNIVQHNTPKGPYKNVLAHIGVIDLTYKYKSNSAIRIEAQGMLRDNTDTLNLGSWVVGLIEWTPNSHIFLAAIDQYNYGNPVAELRLHYFYFSTGYTSGPHRIALSYGKQRAGIFCVGGVCRTVPASNGFAITITSSF
jgi:hypothetical protein